MRSEKMQFNDDIRTSADTPVWDMLADAGIDLDRVTVQPDGVWNVRTDAGRVAFGPSELPEETEDGGEGLADGWDWARYGEDGQIEAQDYAAGSDDLIAVLNGIPGAYERAAESLQRGQSGDTIDLDEL